MLVSCICDGVYTKYVHTTEYLLKYRNQAVVDVVIQKKLSYYR